MHFPVSLSASWGYWDQDLHSWCFSSLACDALQLPHDSCLFLGMRTPGGKLYHGLVSVWTCQIGNHRRWEAIFVPLASLDTSVPQRLFEMLSTVYVIILVEALISPSLFSQHAAWLQGWIMWQCLKACLQQCSCLSVIFMFEASGGPDNLHFHFNVFSCVQWEY